MAIPVHLIPNIATNTEEAYFVVAQDGVTKLLPAATLAVPPGLAPGGTVEGAVQFRKADGTFDADAAGFLYTAAGQILTIGGSAKVNTIIERTINSGVTIDGMLCKDGLIDGRDPSVDGAKLDAMENGGTVSVKAHGAVGNGVADDTAAIQAALNAGAHRVVIPPGTYKVTAPLVMYNYQILEGLGGWENVVLSGDNVAGGIIQPNASWSDPAKTRIQIRNLYLTGTAAYGIRLIKCTSYNLERIRFVFGRKDAGGGVLNSALTNDCLYLGASFEGRASFISAYVQEPAGGGTHARSVVWMDNAVNGVLLDCLRTTAACRYGIALSNTDGLTTEIPTAVTINNATLQRQEIGIYAKRCRAVNAAGLYFEQTKVPIRLGSDDSTSDRCAGFGVMGGYFTDMDGSAWGWGANTTGAVEAIRAHGATFDACTFSDYGDSPSRQMLYLKRGYGVKFIAPTRFNFANDDMRPAVTLDGAWDTESTYTIENNGTKGNQAIFGGVATQYGTAAPVSGTYAVGDRVLNSAPAAGGNEGWICTGAGAPGTWEEFGQIGAA